MFVRRHWWAILFSLFLASFTIYIIMDTFMITRIYAVVPSTDNSAKSSVVQNQNDDNNNLSSADSNVIHNDFTLINSYSDQNKSITITQYRQYDTSIYVADIKLSSIEYLKTAFAQNSYGRNVTEKTSQIAKRSNALLAINGDYYGAQETGYVIRNGILYRSTAAINQDDLVIYSDGSFDIITEKEVPAQTLIANGALQVLSFGPALIDNGKTSVTDTSEVSKAMSSNPRTAIGIIDNLHYVFVVADGRTDESKGLSLLQLSEFLKGLNVITAYNLDGGGSSTMYFNGEVINNPTTSGKSIKERGVSDIVYIEY